MKKFFHVVSIVIINFFIFLTLLICLDAVIFYKNQAANYTSFTQFFEHYTDFYKEVLRPKSQEELYNQYILGEMKNGEDFYRPVANINSKEKPIILFGCSFVYGILIPDDAIFSEVLAKYTNRPVYNRARDGFGPSLMLYQLQNENFYKLIPEPEYIIYTFINDQPKRMFTTCTFQPYYYNIFYKMKNGKIVPKKYFSRIFLFEFIKNNLYNYKYNYNKKVVDLLRAHFLESEKLIKAHWPNTKFVIFAYTNNISPMDILKPELEQKGIKVIFRNDIAPFEDFSPDYALSKTDAHPNEKAWTYITPILMKEIEKNND